MVVNPKGWTLANYGPFGIQPSYFYGGFLHFLFPRVQPQEAYYGWTQRKCNGKKPASRSAPGKSEKPLSPYPSRLEGLVWIRLGFSSDFPQELGLYAWAFISIPNPQIGLVEMLRPCISPSGAGGFTLDAASFPTVTTPGSRAKDSSPGWTRAILRDPFRNRLILCKVTISYLKGSLGNDFKQESHEELQAIVLAGMIFITIFSNHFL